jgi:hypothetical protein
MIAVPALAVLTMYIFVYIRTARYIVAIAVLLFALALASVRVGRQNQALARAVLAAGIIVFTLTNLPATLDAIAALSKRSVLPTVAAGERLDRLGIPPNSRVGTVGAGMYAYWARLARVNIAAEIWDDDAPLFWNADLVRRNQVLCVMGRSGASAIVGFPPPNIDLTGWQPLGTSGFWMHRVSQQECGSN